MRTLLVFVRRLWQTDAAPLLGANLAIGLNAVVTGIVIARVLGPDGRGAFAVIVLWAALIAIVGEMGIADAVVILGARQALATTVIRACAIAAASSAAFVTVGWVCMPLLLTPEQATLLPAARRYLAFVPATLFSGIATGALYARHRFKAAALSRYASSMVYIIGVLALAARATLTPQTLADLGVVVAAVPLAIALVQWPWLAVKLGKVDSWSAEQLFTGARLHSTKLSTNLATFTDRAVGARLLPQAAFGLYQVPISLVFLLGFIPQAFGQVVVSRLPSLPEASHAIFVRRNYVRSTILVGISAVLLIPVLPVAIPLVYGKEFRGAVVPAVVFVVAGILTAGATVLQGAAKSKMAVGVVVRSEVTAIAIVLLLALPLTKAFGVGGLAATYLCGRAATLTSMIVSLPKYLNANWWAFVPGSNEYRSLVRNEWADLVRNVPPLTSAK